MRNGALLVLLLLAATGASAGMAEKAHRRPVAGIDVVTYRTSVKDVVVILGALPAGDAMSDGANIAVPTLSGMMLDRGTKALDKFAVAEKLDSVGAEIGFAVGPQSLEIHAKCLKRDMPMVMGLIAADLRTPALSLSEFNKAKQQFIGELESASQNSGGRAREAFNRAIFPAGHPNRPHTLNEYLQAAKAATLDEVKAFQAKYYGPAHMVLVVAGDVGDAESEAEITKAFAGWSGGQDYLHAAKAAAPLAASEVSVPLADKPSVTMILGQATGLRYKDPDSLALHVGTAVLGHGFTGRLMASVRDKEGLTYNISSNVSEDAVADGAWDISASFAPALLAKGLAATRRELEKWWKEGISEQELSTRKQGIIGSYQVGMSTTSGIAGAILVDIQRGFDLSWLDDFPKAVNALTRDQVNTAIHRHLNPSVMALIKVGSIAATTAAPN